MMGLTNRLTPPGKALETALALATEISRFVEGHGRHGSGRDI